MHASMVQMAMVVLLMAVELMAAMAPAMVIQAVMDLEIPVVPVAMALMVPVAIIPVVSAIGTLVDFGGFGNFGGFGTGYGGAGNYGNSSNMSEDEMHMRAAANYINNQHYAEALNVLNTISNKTAAWYYYSAIANKGVGNNVQALEHARMASSMEPNNATYRQLVRTFESGGSWYTSRQSSYGGMPTIICSNPLLACCLANLCCNACCAGCGGGYTYR